MELTKKDVKKVRAFLYEIREKWYCIGVGLLTDPVELEKIKVQFHDNPAACLVEIVTVWLKSKHRSTWEALANALKVEGVNEMKLAEEAVSKEKEITMPDDEPDGATEVEDSPSLTRWDVRHVRALLSDIKDKWHDIGIELEIDIDKLSKIKLQHSDDPAACLLEMITLWLKFIKNPPKWETLADALRCRVINEEKLAEKALSKITDHKESEAEQGTVLNRFDLKKIKKFLQDVDVKKWMDIGVDLGLDIDVLFKIRASGDDPADCMRDMITVWLKFVNPLPTWGTLSIALRANNEVELAEKASWKHTDGAEVNPQDQKYELTRWELKQVRALLFDVREKWLAIGDELEIDTDILVKIKAKYHNEPAACLIEMIRVWLKCINPPATWATLSHVLRSSSINEVKFAEEACLKDKSLGKEENQDTASELQETVLCRLDLKQVKEFLFEVQDKWLDIGIELGVDIDELFRIKSEFNNNPADCLREMIIAWLKFYAPLPSLKTLCEALCSKHVDEVELAEQALKIHPCTETIETGEQNEENAAKLDDNILTRQHVKQVRTFLFDLREKWMNIGIELEIDIDILVKIRQRHHNDPAECLKEMITEWLKFINPPPTRDALIEALQATAIDEKKLAEGLAQGFGSVPPTDTTREDQNPSEKESSQPESENEASIVSNDSNENEENTPVASSVPNCNPDKLDQTFRKLSLNDITFAINNENEQYSLIKYISGHWHRIGMCLRMTNNDLSNLEDDCKSHEERCIKVMGIWEQNAIGLPNASRYPYSWKGLHQLLHDSKLGNHADDFIHFMES